MMSASSWTQRGKGSCPSCGWAYSNRYKPKNCPVCDHELGGNYVSTKRPRLEVPKCTIVASNSEATWYSSKTSSHDDRCIVVVDRQGGGTICYHPLCKQQRAVLINSQKGEEFSCQHIEYIGVATQPIKIYCTLEHLEHYRCDESTKKCLQNVADAADGLPLAVQVSPSMFCVFGSSSANSPSGYCHVKFTGPLAQMRCCSKDCRTYVAKTKQLKSKCICLHVQVLLCLGVMELADKEENSNSSNQGNELCESLARASTITLKMKFSLPEIIPPVIIRKSGIIEASDGWPEVMEPTATECGLCGSNLGPSKPHPGSRGISYIITNMRPFHQIKVLVKSCVNTSCLAMHQVCPYELGLFNICDKVLVSFEILLEWRQLFRRGVSISIAIKSKLEAMSERVEQEPPSKNEQENIANLLYNGFYCFEAVTERNIDSTICGICGIAGEVYLGDGNEKNCCNINEIDYSRKTSNTSPPSLEDFLHLLKRQWVECTTYTRNRKITFNVSDIPPIIAPAMRGETVFNTEPEKKSTILKNNCQKAEGDSALLHSFIIKMGFQMENLQKLELPELKDLCTNCGISTTQKSQQRMRIDIQSLYETLLVGSSPCHNFTKVPGHTGGFYHIVCRHGVTVASKFLTLQESVRDAADLYLSFKHHPLVFLCDTACGFVRHMDCRIPHLTAKLWGKYGGCFEEPKLDVPPSKNVSVPMITTAEYRDQDSILFNATDTNVHPLTGDTRRFVLGDRFHNASNPHKSPLCLYHDLDLAQQSNTIKTSYQESENNRKNLRRLRSSCVQGFSTHFMYNFLMDFYQNQEIIKEQYAVASKNLKDGQKIVRDRLLRFTIQE